MGVHLVNKRFECSPHTTLPKHLFRVTDDPHIAKSIGGIILLVLTLVLAEPEHALFLHTLSSFGFCNQTHGFPHSSLVFPSPLRTILPSLLMFEYLKALPSVLMYFLYLGDFIQSYIFKYQL